MNIVNYIFYQTPLFYLIQSIWRDEAFSYFMAKPDLVKVIVNTAHDFNPPFYYLILHLWMQVVGKSDVGLRLLSFFAFALSVYVASLLAEKIFSRRFAIFVAAFTFFNPMLLYYAFEIRMYSFYALFTVCSLYFWYKKEWKWYLITSVLGLYTHSFFILVPLSFIIYYFLTKQNRRRLVINTAKPLLFFLPWLPVLVNQFIRSKDSWIFPVDLQLVKSVLGNLFTNFEGTPGDWWSLTFWLSVIILVFLWMGFRQNKKQALLFLTPIVFTLSGFLGYSYLRRPIYVNRYLIFITVFEIFGISLGIWSIKNKLLRNFTAGAFLLLVIVADFALIPSHRKTDFKTAFSEINKNAEAANFVYTQTPISFLESAFYYKFPEKVFIFNPNNVAVPDYIGVNVVFPAVSRADFPSPPSKTYLIKDNATYEIFLTQ